MRRLANVTAKLMKRRAFHHIMYILYKRVSKKHTHAHDILIVRLFD